MKTKPVITSMFVAAVVAVGTSTRATATCCGEFQGNCLWFDIYNELHTTNCTGENVVCCTGSQTATSPKIYVCCEGGHCLFFSDSQGQLYATCDGTEPWTVG